LAVAVTLKLEVGWEDARAFARGTRDFMPIPLPACRAPCRRLRRPPGGPDQAM